MAYQIDNAHSQIQFTVRHMMISKVRGWFDKFDGTVNLNEKNPSASTVEIRIDMNSIETRDEQRDAHLISPDFFDTDKYPYANFKSTRVEVVDDNHAHLYGNLTIKAITREVVLDVEYTGSAKSPWGTTSYGFSARSVVNRKNWDLNWNKALETGGVLVGDEITLDIELELVQVPEEEAEKQSGA